VSRGFRDADATQAMSDAAVAGAIDRVLSRGREETPNGDGLCQDCGHEIGDERLAALPSAVRCVRCQAAWEQANPY